MIGIDTEYIPENAEQCDLPGNRPDVERVYCEVMQIGACKLDVSGREIGTLNLTIQTHRIATIPSWLSKMTGMTEDKRAKGVSFPEALKQLQEFVGNDKDIWTFSGDWWVFEANAKAHDITLPFLEPFKRLKPLLSQYGISIDDFKRIGFNEVCSGGLHQVLGIQLPAQGVGAHDATHDARSLVHSVYHLHSQ